MSNSFNSAKVTEWLPVGERAANSAYHLVKICLSVFLFDIWDGLCVLIRSVPEVSLLLYCPYGLLKTATKYSK